MSTFSTSSVATTFGYLSAIESAEHGYFGGYLLISALGRPIEFHCTAPIRPSRAQEILYGPTLRPYLLGEQIAGTLIAKAQSRPQIILTDQSCVLCHRWKSDVPLVCIAPVAADNGGCDSSENLLVGGYAFQLAAGFASDRQAAISLLTPLAKHVDLPEPFERIREAILEAHRIDERGPDAYAHAA